MVTHFRYDGHWGNWISFFVQYWIEVNIYFSFERMWSKSVKQKSMKDKKVDSVDIHYVGDCPWPGRLNVIRCSSLHPSSDSRRANFCSGVSLCVYLQVGEMSEWPPAGQRDTGHSVTCHNCMFEGQQLASLARESVEPVAGRHIVLVAGRGVGIEPVSLTETAHVQTNTCGVSNVFVNTAMVSSWRSGIVYTERLVHKCNSPVMVIWNNGGAIHLLW